VSKPESQTAADLRENFERAWLALLREQQEANGFDNLHTLAAMRVAFGAGWHSALKESRNAR
jgi:hypothetical protein